MQWYSSRHVLDHVICFVSVVIALPSPQIERSQILTVDPLPKCSTFSFMVPQREHVVYNLSYNFYFQHILIDRKWLTTQSYINHIPIPTNRHILRSTIKFASLFEKLLHAAPKCL